MDQVRQANLLPFHPFEPWYFQFIPNTLTESLDLFNKFHILGPESFYS